VAQLKIISETGMFHSACFCTFDNPTRAEWYGFLPAVHRRPVSKGKVDRANRSANLNHYILLNIPDVTLDKAIKSTVAQYQNKDYVLAVRDCVSFSADLAYNAGLKVPRINMTPYGFIKVLCWWNNYVEFK
jgi:hypothetical protein